jgi:hypothetical protein
MATTEISTILTVPELRERWLPHKERFNLAGSGHPTAVRFHRACSWLEEAEHLDAEEQADHILIFQWTAFNALYGQWDVQRHESLSDRLSWQVFLTRMLDLDATEHLVTLLQQDRRLVLTILGNAYLNGYFWHDPCCQNAGKAGRSWRHKAEGWYAQKDWKLVLEKLVDRIYLLRCQLVHGAATLRSKMNRTAVKHCTTMMRKLLPTLLLVWIDHGADEDWGIMCYPPVDTVVKGGR